MKKRELLPVGAKPAPGDLAFVQAFANVMRHIQVRSDIDGVTFLRTWLVRHGLLSPGARIDTAGLKTALLFHDGLRGLLLANSGGEVGKDSVRRLNQLARKFKLNVVFQTDGTASLRPASRGIENALGKLLAVVIQAMADGSWWRLKVCRERACQWVYFDSSKNRSGRWCSMSVCGARTKARAYRKRCAGAANRRATR